jgi:hypothetical protein
MPTLDGRTKEQWFSDIEAIFSIALDGEDIPLNALLYGKRGKITKTERAWARAVIQEQGELQRKQRSEYE